MEKKKREKKQKIKKERKAISNMDKFMLVFLATLIIYLAIILPIRLCVVAFSWHWFVFGLVAVIIPFAFIHFQLGTQKKFAFTDEQKQNASVVTFKYILYFWFLDCLYMTIFNQWKVWIYILGVITLIKTFYGLAITFLGKKQKNTILDISLVFDFLLGISLTVYLIYLIPNEFTNLQTILTAIVAAVYGGLITLVGVAWTINCNNEARKQDLERINKERKEEEINKAKPYLQLIQPNNDIETIITIDLPDSGHARYESFRRIYISNVGGLFIFEAISFNGVRIACPNKLIAKDDIAQISLRNLNYSEHANHIEIRIYGRDKLDNRYSFNITNRILIEDGYGIQFDAIEMPILENSL